PYHQSEQLTATMVAVSAATPAVRPYFPERYLAQWLSIHDSEASIYCFPPTGVRPLQESYAALVRHLELDTIILVDGGTDSLMRGDEVSLGTPHEDAASIVAVNEVEVAHKLLVCLGFGIDRHHGICHADFLEAVAAMIRADGYLGMFSLLPAMPEVQQYQAAVEAVFQAMPRMESIVSSSILAALAGEYGDYHRTARTAGSTLWINPLMAAYWCFQLAPVAERLLYGEALKATVSRADVDRVIASFRAGCGQIRSRTDIPV
ncbi:MAG TPA: DUF1152 domain-containing protein, partial [Herpetosiphonaceae bacterium]|nr:DUF1152 domain-containing protein [Herpetosiphonaceae bacterium]